MQIERSIKFHILPLKNERGAISMSVKYCGQRKYIRIGVNTDKPENWDDKMQRFLPGTLTRENVAELNSKIFDAREKMEDSFRRFEAEGIIPSFDILMGEYTRRTQKTDISQKRRDQVRRAENHGAKAPKGLFEAYKAFIIAGTEKNSWSQSTIKKMNTLYNDLKAFRRDLTFEDLDEDGLTEFLGFLKRKKVLNSPRRPLGQRKHYDYDDKHGLCDVTIFKKLRQLKWFLNYATQKGYNTVTDYKTFRPTLRMVNKPVIYLTREELKTLMDMDIPDSRRGLKIIRDIFLFCCFTSLRYSDVENLRHSDIRGGKIHIVTVKTLDRITIELNSHARDILAQYETFHFKGDRVFPTPTNQVMNRELKELCRIAGIDTPIRTVTFRDNGRHEELKPKWEMISSHAGRRTFIVNMLSMGVSAEICMKWTGHSDYQAMKPYIDIAQTTREEMMDKWSSWV